MGRRSGHFRPRNLLFLLVALAAAAIAALRGVPQGTSPAIDRAREEADRLLDALPTGDGKPAAKPAPATGALHEVERVVDGDTIVLAGGERVRLIGVNTPESVDPRRPVQWYGKEAAAWTRKSLLGRKVRLEHDVERKDRYGRTLAYVFLEDGTFVNLRIVEEGMAFAYRFPPNVAHADEFRDAERRARESRKGLWSDPEKAAAIQPKSRR